MPTHLRIGEITQGVFDVLRDEPAGLPFAEVRSRVLQCVPPLPTERSPDSNYLGGWTTGLVKAGWLRKENRRWYLTDEGRAACEAYRDVDPEALGDEITQRYRLAMGEISSRSRPPL
jgi:hypothetical protein